MCVFPRKFISAGQSFLSVVVRCHDALCPAFFPLCRDNMPAYCSSMMSQGHAMCFFLFHLQAYSVYCIERWATIIMRRQAITLVYWMPAFMLGATWLQGPWCLYFVGLIANMALHSTGLQAKPEEGPPVPPVGGGASKKVVPNLTEHLCYGI